MCFFLILFTALIYLMHFRTCVCIKKRDSFPSSLACLPSATDWAITDGDALKRLVRRLKRQPVGMLTLLQMWQFI